MENAAETAALGKKRILGLEESELPTHLFQLKKRRLAVVTPVNSLSSVNCEYSTCGCVISSDNVVISAVCFSNGSSELEKIQKEYIDEETGDPLDCREGFRRETSPLLQVQSKLGDLESTARALESSSRPHITVEKMPSEDELKEFFTAAEKNLQKQFVDKYNFDIEKDEPLEGRYDWVHIQPKLS